MDLREELCTIFEALGWEVKVDVEVEDEAVPLYLVRKVGDPLASGDACVFYFESAIDEHAWKRDASLQALRNLFRKRKSSSLDVSFFVVAPSYHPKVYENLRKYAKAVSFAELQKGMIRFSGYCRQIVGEFQEEIGKYYAQRLVHFEGEKADVRSDEFALRWCGIPDTPVCMVIAEAGMGKTTFTKYVCSALARRYLEGADENWVVPVRIPLHEYRYGAGTFESLVQEHFRRCGYDPFPVGALVYYLARRKAVLVLDGFDEMLSASGDAATKHNMEIVAKGLPEGACVMLTCRSQYFRSPDELRDYMGLFGRPGFEVDILKLSGFDEDTIAEFCTDRLDREAARVLAGRLQQDADLLVLAKNPFLLDSLAGLCGDDPELPLPASREMLIKSFCDLLIKRDQSEKVRESWSAKFDEFFGRLAFALSREGRYSFGEETAKRIVEDTYADDILAADDIDREHRNASRQILQSAMLKKTDQQDDASHEFLHPLLQQHMCARNMALAAQRDEVRDMWGCRLWPQELCGDLVQVLTEQALSGLIQNLISQAATSPTLGSNACRLLVEAQSRLELSPWRTDDRLFAGKNLMGLELRELDLQGVVFDMSMMARTRFIRCDLSKADFRKAQHIDQTLFEDCNLSGTLFLAHGKGIRSVQTSLGVLRRNDAIAWLLQMGAEIEGSQVKPLPTDHGREIAWRILRKFYNQRNIRKKRDSLVRHGFSAKLSGKASEVLDRLAQLGFVEELPKRASHEAGYRLVPSEATQRLYEDKTDVPREIADAWPV